MSKPPVTSELILSIDLERRPALAEQLRQAEEIDRQYPPTIGWYEALIDALERSSLSAETKEFLIRKHRDEIAKLKNRDEK